MSQSQPRTYYSRGPVIKPTAESDTLSFPTMDVAFSVPDRLAERLEERWGDLSERALQAIVADGYREEALTLGEVREILGHSTRLETEQFLKDRGILLEMTAEELEEDARAAREARS